MTSSEAFFLVGVTLIGFFIGYFAMAWWLKRREL